MATTGNGDDKRSPSETPSKVVIRTGESATADTAIARVAVSATGDTQAHTDVDVPAPHQGEEDELVGQTLLGRYNVTRKIGQGGMGAVYEATHALIGKRVAIKVLLDKYARKDQIVARLEQEARLASAIGHEHIIDITDFGTTGDGRTFVVMEFLEGESLAECLLREGTLPEQRILLIAQQIASALGAAHAKGIVHRDVKPENVFLLRRKDKDFVKVVDFGISKNMRSTGEGDSPRLTQTGMVLGTPLYMSAEQARGDEELDHRIDVYALGVIMYELATGKVPFSGNNYLSVISQVLNDDPKRPRELRPDLSEEFEAIVLRALEKEREKRYQTTDEILADINALVDDPMRSTSRPRITAPRRLRGRGGATRILIWVVGVSLVVAAVAVTVSMMMGGGGGKPKAAASDGGARTALSLDGGPATPAVDAAAAGAAVEIWINTSPGKATIVTPDGQVFRAPFPYKTTEGAAPVTLSAELDGYETTSFTIDPAKYARYDSRKSAFVVKLPKQKRGGGGGTVKKTDPGVGSGSTKPPPDDSDVHCPGDVKPNPITHKCPGG